MLFHRMSCDLCISAEDGVVDCCDVAYAGNFATMVSNGQCAQSADATVQTLCMAEPDCFKKGTAMTSLDPRSLRNAFGTFMTGVTVVTSHDSGGQPLGFTANSFTSVSIDPPMVLVCLANTSQNYDALVSAKGVAVNILAETQMTSQIPLHVRLRIVSPRLAGERVRKDRR